MTIDIKRVMDLADSGLFWIHDENEVNHGWAVICGYDDTPYHGGAFCFDVRFPDNYPFEPPIFSYLTNDGKTRFNPNLYKNGKVCISLLNTWPGEQWSGVQNLTSILQSIQTAVLNQDPLVNEPAHPASRDPTHPELQIYNRMTFHATIETAILDYIANPPAFLVPVYDAVKAWVLKARPALITKARTLATIWDGRVETVTFYSMTTKYHFGALADQLEGLC